MLSEGYLTNRKFTQPVRKNSTLLGAKGGELLKSRGKRKEAGLTADVSSAQTSCGILPVSISSSVRVLIRNL